MIQRLAWARDGIITRRALLEHGVPASVVDRLIGSGFLTPIHRGVFAVGWPRPTDGGVWRAAVAAGGEGAMLSHRTAGALFGVLPAPGCSTHVTVPSRRRTVSGIVGHVSPVPDRSATVRDGFPCVTLARALVEIAGTDGRPAVERAWGRAASANLLRTKDLLFEVSRSRGTPGVGLVRELLAVHDGYLVQRSKVDGRGPHEHRSAFDTDRDRQAVLNLAGWRVTHLTHDDVHRRLFGPAASWPCGLSASWPCGLLAWPRGLLALRPLGPVAFRPSGPRGLPTFRPRGPPQHAPPRAPASRPGPTSRLRAPPQGPTPHGDLSPRPTPRTGREACGPRST